MASLGSWSIFAALLFIFLNFTESLSQFRAQASSPHARWSVGLSSEEQRALVARDSVVMRAGLANATRSDIDNARKIVSAAIRKSGELNTVRLANPARNRYPGEKGLQTQFSPLVQVSPLFEMNEETTSAATLVAEADATMSSNMSTLVASGCSQPSNFWMEKIARKGTWPYGKHPDYKVFRSVCDYGAVGDGYHDDSDAITKAITDGQRCGEACYGSTTLGAIVYFPSGTYLISKKIKIHYNTQLIGNPQNKPILKAAHGYIGLGLLSTDEYTGGGKGVDGQDQEWFINTANFYSQIRNFVIDISDANQFENVSAIHYQVSQATSLYNIDFIASKAMGTNQRCVFAENGSGGFMSDLTFTGGAFGIYAGNQQFTAMRLKFSGVGTAIQVFWDWGWTWQDIQISDCNVGFKLVGLNGDRGVGSIHIQDSQFKNVDTAVLIYTPDTNTGKGTTGLTLDNILIKSVKKVVADESGKTWLDASKGNIDIWQLGPLYLEPPNRLASLGNSYTARRSETLTASKNDLPKAPYFQVPKKQYESVAAEMFVHVKDQGAKGDGSTDDTAALQAIFNKFSNAQSIIFIDAGSYIIKDTLTIPPGARIVGECWPQFMATGSKFQDMKNPRPMIRVGDRGSIGTVEIQDLIFSSKGPTDGLVVVEWNIKADKPGSAAMWDCHVRIGGATGTDLTSANCPPSITGINKGCNGASLMMHITEKASAYLENVWLWGADHDLDDLDWKDKNNTMTRSSIYVARGILVESKGPTWLYGTSSEHSVYYQYNFYRAENVLAAMIQTESPYFQPTPKPPAPFDNAVGVFHGDPEFNCSDVDGGGCDASWALQIVESADITIAGAGLYSWFSTYSENCVDPGNCQKALVKLKRNGDRVRLFNLVTIGATNMISTGDSIIAAKDNMATDKHPFWSQITVYDPVSMNRCANLRRGFETLQRQSNSSTAHWTAFAQTAREVERVNASYIGNTSVVPPPEKPDPTLNRDIGRIVLINSTPYNWIQGKNTAQFTGWNWGNIKPGIANAVLEFPISIIANTDTVSLGQSARIEVDFTITCDRGGSKISANTTFTLDGQGKSFTIRARLDCSTKNKNTRHIEIVFDSLTTDTHPKGTIYDMGFRSKGEVIFVIAGDETRGYYTTANQKVSWMNSMLNIIGDMKLKSICMPGSHDAGMDRISGSTFGVKANNTQTQQQDIYHQLTMGSRYFDIRPVLGNGGQWLAGHYSDGRGGNGLLISDIISQVNQFTRENKELILINLSHAFDTDHSYADLSKSQWDALFTLLEGINYRYINSNLAPGKDLTELHINDFIGGNKACVLIFLGPENTGNAQARPNKGIYGKDQFPRLDWYSETMNQTAMAIDQISKLKSNKKSPDDRFHLLSWTLTFDTIGTIGTIIGPSSIKEMAVDWAYDLLFSTGWAGFSSQSYPQVLYMD